jgi:hypothetical protein
MSSLDVSKLSNLGERQQANKIKQRRKTMPMGICVLSEFAGGGVRTGGGIGACPHPGEIVNLNSRGQCGACSRRVRRRSRDEIQEYPDEFAMDRLDTRAMEKLIKLLELANSLPEILTMDERKTIRGIAQRHITDIFGEPLPEEKFNYRTQEEIMRSESAYKERRAKDKVEWAQTVQKVRDEELFKGL